MHQIRYTIKGSEFSNALYGCFKEYEDAAREANAFRRRIKEAGLTATVDVITK